MVSIPSKIELFHLMFLRLFSAQIDPKLYAIKGGCNLRFFFNSVRYSEDLDLDACTIHPKTLEQKINKILTTPPLLKLLQGSDITRLSVTTPKQTATTQRWKIQLHVGNLVLPIPTKIECSRRERIILAISDNVSLNICQTHHLPPMRFSHYSAEEAIKQKILALAHRSLTQARDVFDLYHLLHIKTPKRSEQLEANTLQKAGEALFSIHFDDYKSQVVNFLEPEARKTYEDEGCWKNMSNEVFHYLNAGPV